MANSFSQGKGRLVEPPYGSYTNSWQLPVNSNFGLTDALVSGTTTLSTSTLTPAVPSWTLVFQDFDTNSTPWLAARAGQNLRILVAGALAYDATILIPQNFPGLWVIDNQTSGSFLLTVKTTSPTSTGVVLPQGYMSSVFCDGTNVKFSDLGAVYAVLGQAGGIVPTGAILPFGGTAAPVGYLLCNGAAVSRTTYSTLFSAISTTWGSGDGSTTFNVPDLTNQFLRGAGTSPVGTAELDTFKSHTHTATVTDPGHVHGVPQGNRFDSNPPTYASGDDYTNNAFNYPPSKTATTGITVTNTSTGDTETRPVNKRVLYVIKT